MNKEYITNFAYFGGERKLASKLNKLKHKLIVMVNKKGFKSCYKEIYQFAEEKLDARYKTETAYHIPVEYFNVIENDLGYKSKELRALFMKHGICDFKYEHMNNTVRIRNLEDKGTTVNKVITVTKIMKTH